MQYAAAWLQDGPGQMGLDTHGVHSTEQKVLGCESLLFVFKISSVSHLSYALGYVPGGHLALINAAAEG